MIWDIAGLVALLAFWFGMLYFAKSLARLEKALDRIELAAALVASDLLGTNATRDDTLADIKDTQHRMEDATVVVADNLTASTGRADAADDTGSAADAALRSQP